MNRLPSNETKATDETVRQPKRSLTKSSKKARESQALLEQNACFSLEELKNIFTEIAETGSYKRPDDTAIEQVFRHLELLKDWTASKALLQSRFEKSQKLQTALHEVAQLLPFFVDEVNEAIDGFKFAPPEMHTDLAALQSVARAIEILNSRALLLKGTSSVRDAPPWWELPAWTELAPELARLFRSAMHSADPDVEFGNSSNGPVARFVSTVLARTTGESLRPETIFAFLKNLPRQ